MKGKRKRLTNSQSELVATYLPKKIQKDRKIPTSVKLVLANIYQLHYLQKNWGKRTVFRTRKDFMKDIEAKDKNELNRPRDILVAGDKITYIVGSDGQATEYILNDELYGLLPSQIKGEKTSVFANVNQLNNSQLEIENQEVIVPSHNSMIDSELQHLNVPSVTGTVTGTHEYNISSNKDINKTILHDKPETVLHELESVEELTNENKNKTIPPDINGYQFWENPTWYVFELTSRPYDDTYKYLIDFMHYGELRNVREALSQMDNQELAEQLNNEIDNCIQMLKSA